MAELLWKMHWLRLESCMKVVKVYGAASRTAVGQCRFDLDVATPGQADQSLVRKFGLQLALKSGN